MIYLIILLATIVGIYFSLIHNFNYWKRRGVPFERPSFIFGNFKEVILGRKHIGMHYADVYKKFKSVPYSGFFKLNEPAMIINDLELIKNIVIKDFTSFADNDFQINFNDDPIWSRNAFPQVGERWKKIRAAWNSSLTQTKLKGMYEDMSATCEQDMEHLKSKDPFELRLLAAKFFTDSTVASVFGLNVDSFADPQNPYMKITQSLFPSTYWDGLVGLTFFIAPWIGKLFKFRFVSKENEDELLKLAKPVIDRRHLTGFQKNNPFDSILLYSGQDSVTEIEVAATIFSFLLDGTETSSGVGGYLLYSLAAYPEVQRKLREEIDEAVKNNQGKLSHKIIHELPYLDMCLNETVRMYPPLLSTQRICTKEYELPPVTSGRKPVTISKGMSVVIPVYGLHMDPEYFPEPDKFQPERFSTEKRAGIPKYAFMPFGDGPRMCLGARFAINEVKILIAHLIRNFELRISPQMANKSLKIDSNIFLYRNAGGLWATFHQRKLD